LLQYFFQSVHAKTGYDIARCHPIQTTASQLLVKPRDAAASVAQRYNSEFAAIIEWRHFQ